MVRWHCSAGTNTVLKALATMQSLPWNEWNFQKGHVRYASLLSLLLRIKTGKNFNRLSKLFPDDYNYHPRTFLLPTDYGDLRAVLQKKEKKATFIVKPDASSQGKGIYLTRNLDEIDPMANIIVQEYIQKVTILPMTLRTDIKALLDRRYKIWSSNLRVGYRLWSSSYLFVQRWASSVCNREVCNP